MITREYFAESLLEAGYKDITKSYEHQGVLRVFYKEHIVVNLFYTSWEVELDYATFTGTFAEVKEIEVKENPIDSKKKVKITLTNGNKLLLKS